MITIGGRPAAAVYADALREKLPYTITHTDESFRVLSSRGADGSLQVYIIDATHIHCRMYGQPFGEGELAVICGAVTHLPWSLQVTTAILEAATWLDKTPRNARTEQRP